MIFKDQTRRTSKLRRASESGLRKVTQVLPNDIAANPFANPFNKKRKSEDVQGCMKILTLIFQWETILRKWFYPHKR